MFDSLIIFIFLKYPNYLTKIFNELSWLFAFLYARIKTSFTKNYLIESSNNSLNKKIYCKQKNNSLNLIDFGDVQNCNSDRYYVRITNKNSVEKILVFDDKLTLMNQYNELLNKFEKHIEHFSTLLEAIVNDKDVLPIIKKYLGGKNNYYDITRYNIKYGDIYDFDSNIFLLETKDEITVVNMALHSSKHYFNDLIIFNNS